MTKYSDNKRYSKKNTSAPSQFLGFIVSFILGYLAASFLDIATISHWMNTQVLAHDPVKPPNLSIKARQSALPPKPKFEFYTLLANEKTANEKTSSPTQPTVNGDHAVNLPVPSLSSQPHATSPNVATTPKQSLMTAPVKKSLVSSKSYLVQVAAFRARPDAEHMKGVLILKGFDVKVVSVSQAQGNWFRVMVGPYANLVLAKKAQFILAKNERLKGMLMSASG